MILLQVFTVFCIATMVGSEFAVSAFVNPALLTLATEPRAILTSHFARVLGRAMPPWYILSLLLILLQLYFQRGTPAFVFLLVAALLWIATILITVLILVPINNRIAAIDPVNPGANWQDEHRRWDLLHRLRILVLALASGCLIYALLSN